MWEKGRKDVEVRRDWMKGRNEEGWRFGRNNPPMNFIGPFPLVKIETHFFQSIVECGRSVYQVDSPSSHFRMLEESPFMSAARWTFWALFYWFLSSCSHWVCRGNVTSPSEMCHLGRHLPMPYRLARWTLLPPPGDEVWKFSQGCSVSDLSFGVCFPFCMWQYPRLILGQFDVNVFSFELQNSIINSWISKVASIDFWQCLKVSFLIKYKSVVDTNDSLS
jgi:hypothetical protein